MRFNGWRLGAVMACCAAGLLRAQTTRPAVAPPEPPPATRPATQPSASAAPATRPVAAAPDTRPVALSLGDPDELLAGLASPDWRVRRRTTDLLVRGGPDAKPFIGDLVQRASSDEARKNALSALAEIDEIRITGPSYLTLHFKDAPPARVFAEISRQCFAPLPTSPADLWEQSGGSPGITVDVDHEPFWKVVPSLCRKAGVGFRPFPNGFRLVRGGSPADGITQVVGPFLVTANAISYTRTRTFNARPEQSQFGMSLSVLPEPKLVVLQGGGAVAIDQAIDDRGHSLVPEDASRNGVWGGFNGSGSWALYATLQYPRNNPGTRIARFRGTTSFLLQTESQKIDLDVASLNQTSRVIHGMRVTFQDMKKSGDGWQLRVRVDQPSFGGPEWQQLIDGVQNRMQILDAEGNPLEHGLMNMSSKDSAMELVLEFARTARADGRPAGEPARLAWEVPTKTRTVPLPIQFDDLPLFDP